MGASVEVQRALFNALSGAGLRVYDVAPQNDVVWPYVEIGYIAMGENDTQSNNGFNVLARIHVRSQSGSAMEAKAIQDQIYGVLHKSALNVTGMNTVLVRHEMSDLLRAEGSFHGVSEYRLLTETL